MNTIAAKLTRHDKPHEFHTYAGAGHAFLNFTNAERHRPEQAGDAWSKVLAFLGRHRPAPNGPLCPAIGRSSQSSDA